MGEIAEMMLDGTLCECCGGYIDDGEPGGFPRYCSPQCAKDRGAVPASPKSACPHCGARKKNVAAHIAAKHAGIAP